MSLRDKYTCTSCNKGFENDLSTFFDHLSEEHEQDKFQCISCPLQLHGATQFINHFLLNHGTPGQEELASTTREGNEYECPMCPFTSDNGEECNTHYLVEHENAASDNCQPNSDSPSSTCPVCFQAIDNCSIDKHVAGHFGDGDDNNSSSKPSTSVINDSDAALARRLQAEEEESVTNDLKERYGFGAGDYLSQGVSSVNSLHLTGRLTMAQAADRTIQLHNHTITGVESQGHPVNDILSRIRLVYGASKDHSTYFCTSVSFFGSSGADFGFGCGYRNIQMLMSCLTSSPHFRKCLWQDFEPKYPSIPKLQSLIEKAWACGFDPQGREQLGGKLVATRKWIGTTEVAALLAQFKIKCEIVDFHQPTGPNMSHPEMFDWVWTHFRSGISVEGCVPSLYMQHQGHSRTIIGAERYKNVTKLIMLDPGMKKQKVLDLKSASKLQDLNCIRKGLNAFNKSQYQILRVTGPADQQFLDSMKGALANSIRIP